MASVSPIKMLTRDEIRTKYEQMARWYDVEDAIYETMSVGRLRRQIIPKASGDVLEVAVGTGKNLRFYPPDARITAIDYSPAMLDQARKKAARLGRAVDFQVMDAEQLAFPDEQFNTVVTTLSGCTFPHPEKVYREMARVCKQNGRILLIEHGRSTASWLGWLQDRLAGTYYRKYACLWNRDALVPIQAAGLAIVASRQVFFGVFHAMEAAKAADGKN